MDIHMRTVRDFIAKDLRTSKYKMRVVPLCKVYNRKKETERFKQEMKNVYS